MVSNNSITTKSYPEYYDNTPSLNASIPLVDISQFYKIGHLRSTADSNKSLTALQAIENINDAIALYFSFIENSQIALGALDVIKSLEKSVSDVQLLYGAGQRSLIDLLSLNQQLNSYRSSHQSTLASIDSTRGKIQALLSTELCDTQLDFRIQNYSLRDIQSIQTQFFADSLELAVATYPQLKYLELAGEAADQLARSYGASYLPTLELSASLQTSNQYGNISGSTKNRYQYSSSSSNSVVLAASWEIFDGGQNYFNMRSQQKLSDSYQQEFLQAHQSLTSEYTSAVRSDLEYTQSIELIYQSLEEAKRSQELVDVAYQAGFKSYLDVINGIQSVYDSLTTLASAYSDYSINRYKLLGYLAFPNLPQSNAQILNIQIRGTPE